jgi:hypothetical protein
MSNLGKIFPALCLAGALMGAGGSANAQDATPSMGQFSAITQPAGAVLPAAFHGGGMHGGFGHGGHGGGHWGRGHGFWPGATIIAPDEYAYGGGCGFYRMRWEQTGLGVWRRRYYECVYG